MGQDLAREIEQFLYREARLLDEGRFDEWLELFADDLKYWMPIRSSRFTARSRALVAAREKLSESDITSEDEMAYMDETKQSLKLRIMRLGTGMAWAEEPPSRTRHIVTNVEVEAAEGDGQFRVYSNFLLFRGRLEHEEDIVVGQRQDRIRRTPQDWRIFERKIILAHNVLAAKNLSSFI
jgi:3-phenylpropionate/cinnamic acid dioxygenase small subunit